MTELVARHLGISVTEAIILLTEKGALDRNIINYEKRLSDYISKSVEFRHKLLNFWEICKQRNKDMGQEYVNIVRALNLNIGNHWFEAGSQLIGFCHKSEAEKALIVKERNKSCLNSGCNRPFSGLGWGHVCVIPAFDMPGRIKTLTFIGISETDGSILETSRNIVYRTWGPREVECGTMFLEQAMKMPDKEIIIASDTLDTLRMSLDYVEKTGKFPPIIVQANQPEKISLSWKLLKNEGRSLTAVGDRAVNMALSDKSLHTSSSPGDWTQPWLGSQKWINKVIEGRCKQADTVETSPLETSKYKTVFYGGKYYEERPDGMYCNDNIECDASLVIEKISSSGGKHYYHGYVKYNTAKIPFTSTSSVMDYGYSKWLKDTCIKNDMDMPSCSKSFSRVAVKVAMLLHSPSKEIVSVDSNDAYAFSSHRISSDGGVIPVTRAGKHCSSVLSSDPLNEFEKGALSDEESGLAWAVIACSLSNALSSKLNSQSMGIGVDPDSFEDVKAVGQKLGCAINKMTGMTFNKSVMSMTLAMEVSLNLPMIADPEKMNAPLQKLNLQRASGSRNCMMGMDRLAVLGARTISRWAYINTSSIYLDDVLESALSKVAIGFLSWMVKNQYRTEGHGLFNKTTHALRAWCLHEGIATHGLEAGLKLVDCDYVSSNNTYITNAFIELCKSFIMMSAIEVYKRNGVRVSLKNEAWLPCREIFKACKHHNVPISEPGKLTFALTATKAAIECRNNPDNRLLSWVIPEEEWQEWSAGV